MKFIRNAFLYINLIVFVCSLVSCKKDTLEDTNQKDTFSSGQGFFVLCEGGFNYNNARLDYFSNSEIFTDVFYKKNGIKVGDVLQSSTLYKDKMFLVVNNSGKIIVVNPATLEVLHEISGLNSPRYLLVVDSNRALVSDLYANKISVLNLHTYEVISQIEIGTWTEKMLLFNNKIYVSCPDNKFMRILDATTLTVIDSIDAGFGTHSLALDANENLWILSWGKSSIGQNAKLTKYDPSAQSISNTFTFPMSQAPTRLSIDVAGENLFYINKHIYKMNIIDTALPTVAFISASSDQNFYGFNLYEDKYIIMDAKDYNSSGEMHIYNSTGTFLNSYSTGINPSDICIY